MSRNTPQELPKNSGMSIDRTAVRSFAESSYANCTRQIMIRTEEPDIPMISLFRTNDTNKSDVQALHTIDKVVRGVRMRCTFQGFWQVCKCSKSRKIHLSCANRLVIFLERRLKTTNLIVWCQLFSFSRLQQTQASVCRLLAKICLTNLNRQISYALQLIKCVSSGHTESLRTFTVSESKQKIQISESKQSYSDQFIIVCNDAASLGFPKCLQKLEQGLRSQIWRYETTHRGGECCKNEKVLVLLSHILQFLKGAKNQSDEVNRELQTQKGPDQQKVLQVYQRLEQQFKQADLELKKSLRQHNKVHAQQIKFLLESQIDLWQDSQSIYFCSSRTFLSALSVKLLTGEYEASPDSRSLEWLMDRILEMEKMSEDQKKLSRFRRSVSLAKQKCGSTLIPLTDKLLEWNACRTMHQQTILKDQSLFTLQIQRVANEVEKFICRYRKSANLSYEPISDSLKLHPKQDQFEPLYTAIDLLIKLLHETAQGQNQKETSNPNSRKRVHRNLKQSSSAETKATVDNSQNLTLISIVRSFRECLLEEDSEKWQEYSTISSNKQFKDLIDILESVNDFLIKKIGVIEAAAQESIKTGLAENKNNASSQQQISRLKQNKYIDRINILERDLKQLSAQTTASHCQLTDLRDKQIKTQELLKSAQAQNHKLTEQNAKLSKSDEKVCRLEIQNKQLEEAVKSLQSDLISLKASNQILTNQLQSSSSATQSTIKNIAHQHNLKLQRQKLSHSKQVQALQAVKQRLELELNELTSKANAQLNSRLAKVIDQFESVSKSNSDLTLRIRAIEAQNTCKQDRIKKLEESAGLSTDLLKLNSQLICKIQILEERISALLSDVSFKSQIIEELRLQVHNRDKHRHRSFKDQITWRLQEETKQQAELMKDLSESIQSLRYQQKSEISLVREQIWGMQSQARDQLGDTQDQQVIELQHPSSTSELNAIFQQPITQCNNPNSLNNKTMFIRLLRNLLCSFMRCPSVEQPPDQISNIISQQLIQCLKKSQEDSEEAFFNSLEQFCIEFVKGSIGSYRAELLSQIDAIKALKSRFTEFLDSQIQICGKADEWKLPS